MRVSVGWKWKVGAYRLKTGCSTCKSSPQAAFDEREHTPPLNSGECEKSQGVSGGQRPLQDTAGEVMGRARIYPHAPARAAKGERRVGARGVSTNQAATRTRFIAIAMRRCCR